MRGRLKVLFLPDYNVTLAERLIPASDVSEQISTAGYEASGTSNMKLMMNGALTVGTRDGATIEMAREAGEENFFLFGLTAEQVAESRGWYDPFWHYWNEPETREALDLIFNDHFSRHEPGVFGPIRETLLNHGDYYMHLADLRSYLETQGHVETLYAKPRCLGAESDPQRRLLQPLLQRSHHQRIRSRDLECQTLSGAVIACQCRWEMGRLFLESLQIRLRLFQHALERRPPGETVHVGHDVLVFREGINHPAVAEGGGRGAVGHRK